MIHIRPATEADVATLFAIRTSVRQNHLSHGQLAELGITPASVAEAIRLGPCCWLAEADGVAAGFAMVDGTAGEVFALFVRPEYEGRGVGRLLLATAETSLFREHARIWLVTDGSDGIRANAFYQRQGWQRVANLDARDVRYEKQAGAVDRLLQDVRLVSETNFRLLCRVRELALAVAPRCPRRSEVRRCTVLPGAALRRRLRLCGSRHAGAQPGCQPGRPPRGAGGERQAAAAHQAAHARRRRSSPGGPLPAQRRSTGRVTRRPSSGNTALFADGQNARLRKRTSQPGFDGVESTIGRL